MTRLKTLAIAAGVGVFGALAVPNALADEWNKKTILTVNEAIQVPGATLQPGKYVMKLLDSQSNRHVVQIFNATESNIVTTILALPNYRLQPTGKTEFTFWETPPGQPKALRAWFYPGDNFGQEFAYPKNAAASIANFAKTSVPTTYAENESQLTTAQVGTVNQQGEEQPLGESYAQQKTAEVAQNSAPPAPVPAATPQEVPVAAPAPALPKTASQYPLIALAGMVCLGLFATLRLVRQS